LRRFLANFKETVGQDGYKVVHQVLSDRLALCIKNISLILLDLLKSCLSVGFFLPSELFLNDLFSFNNLSGFLLLNQVSSSFPDNVLLLILLIKSHIVKWLLKALNVDLEATESLGCRLGSAVKKFLNLDRAL
jgi:hypothetical protein